MVSADSQSNRLGIFSGDWSLELDEERHIEYDRSYFLICKGYKRGRDKSRVLRRSVVILCGIGELDVDV